MNVNVLLVLSIIYNVSLVLYMNLNVLLVVCLTHNELPVIFWIHPSSCPYLDLVNFLDLLSYSDLGGTTFILSGRTTVISVGTQLTGGAAVI